jgi:hypothetical protein
MLAENPPIIPAFIDYVDIPCDGGDPVNYEDERTGL